MRILSAAALLLVSVPIALNAQTPSPSQAPAKGTSNKLLTLVGCVASDDLAPGQYTIVDPKHGTTYRLSGTDMHTYLGQRVEVTREPPRRLKIAGGLVPSANAAAQAGAVDPPPAAAGATGTRRGLQGAEEVRGRSVKSVGGACPQK